jgi:hypothetical protein
MAGEQASLRDLIENGGAQYALAQRTLWSWVLSAIVHGELLPILPEGTTLDTEFNHGGTLWTWRGVASTALKAIDRHIPSNDNWAKTLTLDCGEFEKWLKGRLQFHKISAHLKRPAGAKRTKRGAVAEFINNNYPNGIPAGISLKDVARKIKNETGLIISDRTLRRAQGRK